ncbi:MAG TPA: hypothetical protein PLB02_03765 [Thermoanaerobaculia bacterium]|nr:hypothetical protein [Thermoanaerobaculia bacterium]
MTPLSEAERRRYARHLVLGIGEPLVGRLLLVDALGMSFRTVRLAKDPGCGVCGRGALPGADAPGPQRGADE